MGKRNHKRKEFITIGEMTMIDSIEALVLALENGEKSGVVENFDRKQFLKSLHKKYLTKE